MSEQWPRDEQWQRTIIDKVAKGIPLAISERELAAIALREVWFTPEERTKHQYRVDCAQVEIARQIAATVTVHEDGSARPVVELGQREYWVAKVMDRSVATLKQYLRRARRALD